jgi:hypothetical protein
VNWIVVDGVKPYDGRYEFDLGSQELTTREWGWIKRHTGYLPLTMEEGFRGADPELFTIFAVIALRRAGKIDQTEVAAIFERICDAPFGATIRMELDQPEDTEDADVGPPALSSTGSEPSSGDASETTLVTSPGPPNGSGNPGSDTSRWPRVTSAT